MKRARKTKNTVNLSMVVVVVGVGLELAVDLKRGAQQRLRDMHRPSEPPAGPCNRNQGGVIQGSPLVSAPVGTTRMGKQTRRSRRPILVILRRHSRPR